MPTRSLLLRFILFVIFAITNSSLHAQSPITRALSSTLVVRDGTNRLGSGFFIGEQRAVTNIHVLAGMSDPEFILSSGRRARLLSILGYNEAADIAIVEIDEKANRPLQLANSTSIVVGQKVFALGAPAGLEFSITSGIVSAIRTDVVAPGSKVIQTDAAINPGNSGGPLINEAGSVVGVVSSKLAGASNLGFASHVDHLKSLLKDGMKEKLS